MHVVIIVLLRTWTVFGCGRGGSGNPMLSNMDNYLEDRPVYIWLEQLFSMTLT